MYKGFSGELDGAEIESLESKSLELKGRINILL